MNKAVSSYIFLSFVKQRPPTKLSFRLCITEGIDSINFCQYILKKIIQYFLTIDILNNDNNYNKSTKNYDKINFE